MDDEQAAKFNETSVRKAVPPGIPDFWLNTLKNVPSIGDMVSDCDEAILKYLTDITVDQTNNPASFTLTFHFGENPFFTNTGNLSILTEINRVFKSWPSTTSSQLDQTSSRTKFCTKDHRLSKQRGVSLWNFIWRLILGNLGKIDWKEGKNVTEKVIKKKPKKGANAGRVMNVWRGHSLIWF